MIRPQLYYSIRKGSGIFRAWIKLKPQKFWELELLSKGFGRVNICTLSTVKGELSSGIIKTALIITI